MKKALKKDPVRIKKLRNPNGKTGVGTLGWRSRIALAIAKNHPVSTELLMKTTGLGDNTCRKIIAKGTLEIERKMEETSPLSFFYESGQESLKKFRADQLFLRDRIDSVSSEILFYENRAKDIREELMELTGTDSEMDLRKLLRTEESSLKVARDQWVSLEKEWRAVSGIQARLDTSISQIKALALEGSKDHAQEPYGSYSGFDGASIEV